MAEQAQDEDKELDAMKSVYSTLKELDAPGRQRVLDYVRSRLDVTVKAPAAAAQDGIDKTTPPSSFGTFAELSAAFSPTTDADKALVAGYWLQVCQGGDTFDATAANKELKHIGFTLTNITTSLTSLKKQTPALVIQLKKSGTTKQARKTYKLTVPGVDAVKAKLNG